MEKEYCVYIHICKVNNKKYVGQAIYSLNNKRTNMYGYEYLSRWGVDGDGYKTGKNYIWNAIQKYGWNEFEHIIITTGLNREASIEIEQWLIEELDTTNSEKGYNIYSSHPGGMYKKKGRGRKYTPEELAMRRKESQKKSREKRYSHCKHRQFRTPEEKKELQRQYEKEYRKRHSSGKKVGECNQKPVMQISTGKIFNSATEADKYLNKYAGYVSKNIRKHKNKDWKYID